MNTHGKRSCCRQASLNRWRSVMQHCNTVAHLNSTSSIGAEESVCSHNSLAANQWKWQLYHLMHGSVLEAVDAEAGGIGNLARTNTTVMPCKLCNMVSMPSGKKLYIANHMHEWAAFVVMAGVVPWHHWHPGVCYTLLLWGAYDNRQGLETKYSTIYDSCTYVSLLHKKDFPHRLESNWSYGRKECITCQMW